MRTIITALAVATSVLAWSNPGYAQQAGADRSANDLAPTDERTTEAAQDRAAIADLNAGAVASKRKAVRPEKTFGPDLAATLFSPVGVIVAPINSGLHAVDAAIAPVNAAVVPITGPLNIPPMAAAEPVVLAEPQK